MLGMSSKNYKNVSKKHVGNLPRAAVELAKDWRSDKYLRRLEALMAVADKENSFIISGTGDVLEPEDGIIGIGSGGNYALAAAKVLIETELNLIFLELCKSYFAR